MAGEDRLEDIKTLIANGKLDDAVTSLRDLVSNSEGLRDIQLEVLQISGRLSTLRRDGRLGIESSQSLNLRRSKLSFDLLDLLTEIPAVDSGPLQSPSQQPMQLGRVELPRSSLYVSYAWTDEGDPSREDLVDRLIEDAKSNDIEIMRDKSAMAVGDRISKFMSELAEGDKIIVFLSAKYLKSPFCMFELYQIWMNAQGSEEKFSDRIAVFAFEDAEVWTPKARASHARFWRDCYNESEQYLSDMGERDRIAHLNMKKFSVHVGDILGSISDTVLPKSYPELLRFALR